ncbi:hypothetical protein [Pantoea sp. BL1]
MMLSCGQRPVGDSRRYDVCGKLLSTTHAQGNTWSAAGRLQTYVRADGRETLF